MGYSANDSVCWHLDSGGYCPNPAISQRAVFAGNGVKIVSRCQTHENDPVNGSRMPKDAVFIAKAIPANLSLSSIDLDKLENAL